MAILTDGEIDSALHTLHGWQRNDNELTKEYHFPDFMAAIRFVNRIAEVAEAANHHPELAVGWGHVGVTLSTHSLGGISTFDTALAAKIEALPLD
jgi:4a-hydroxytetrahydrobiopterin dehydratase